jgi:WD40 repeat protein
MAYNAFVSYSHTADSALAAALQAALHRFAKPWYKLRALHIFRDQTNLAVNPALWTSIREALDQSLFFILLASPEAAASPWVAKEAEYWIGRNGTAHVLIVLAGGTLRWDAANGCFTPEHTNALPAGLLRSFSEEPLYLDLVWTRGGGAPLRMREPRFHEAVLQLAATLHNRPKDELDGADIRSRRQVRLVAAGGLIAILATLIIAAWQYRLSHKESVQNLAARLATKSATILADNPDRTREAALLAIESDRLSPSIEANQALRAAVSLLPAGAQFYAPEDASPEQRIRDIAFSPDGSLLAAVRDNGSTQLIDIKTHQAIGYIGPDETPAAHIEVAADPQDNSLDSNSAVSVAFNSTASMVAAGSRDGFAHVWAVSEGRELLRVFLGAPVSQVAFHPKVNQLAIASEDGHVRIFDVAHAAAIADFRCEGKIVSAAYSPAGDLFAALSSEGPVYLFDAAHFKLLRKLFAGGDAALNLAFSHDGQRLATAMGSFAFVWDVATGEPLLKATHAASADTLTTEQWIIDAAISGDGKFLAYAAKGDRSAHIWNVTTGRQIFELKHDSPVAAVSFNADGTKLGTGSYDGTARVWELPSGRELERASHSGGAEVVAFSPDGNRFAAGGIEGSVSVSEMRRADRPVAFDFPGDVRSVAFSPDGKRFAIGAISAHWSPLVRIADTGGNVLRDIEFHGAPMIDKLFFIDANRVIAQWSDKLFLIVIDQGSVTPLPDLPGEKRIEPSGQVMAMQEGGVSRLYALPGLKEIESVDGPPTGLLRSAAEGKLLAFEMEEPPNKVFVDIWNVASKARLSRVALPAELNRVAINGTGATLFTAEGETLQAWEIPSGKRRFSVIGSGDIHLIVPDPSSRYVAVGEGHLTVRDAMTGARLAQLDDTNAAAFSPDGRYLLTGYGGRSAALWLWRSIDLRDEVCARLTRNLSHREWESSFSKEPYRLTCPHLPAGQ